MTKRYYIKISGSAWDIQADSPEAAWKQIREHCEAYCFYNVLEIGKDVNELGWPLKKEPTQE